VSHVDCRQLRFRCLHEGCEDEAIPSTSRCLDHVGSTLQEHADEYALQVILCRERSSHELLSRARFAGTCSHLLAAEAWKRVPWLRREALLTVDLRARGVRFPSRHRVAARMAVDPESEELLG
jgi:hypothetical protein